jgi:hypothetical protein
VADVDQSHGNEDRKAFAALADKYWDLGNTLVGVAVVQTIVFLLALGTNETLDYAIKCTKDGWYVSVVLIAIAFAVYFAMLRSYGTDEIDVRREAGQTDAVLQFARRATRQRRKFVSLVLLITVIAMALHFPLLNTDECAIAKVRRAPPPVGGDQPPKADGTARPSASTPR